MQQAPLSIVEETVMNEPKERPAVFGLETEYALFPVYSENAARTESQYNCPLLFVEQARSLGIPHFCMGMRGIMNAEEHEIVEKLIFLWKSEPARKSELESILDAYWDAMRQRMGQTGTMLSNGSRLYLDMTHPEYATPEVTTPRDLVVAQKAGDRIMEACRLRTEEALREKRGNTLVSLRLWRNNTDYKKTSYGAHENYLVSPELFYRITWGGYADAGPVFATFLATRQIITGAGKAGDDRGLGAFFQISQRADFIETMRSESTMQDRPIINTRNISYGDPTLVRRLHVIAGDSNMSELSIFLKFGTTALVLAMLERGALDEKKIVPLENPVCAFHAVSRDLSLKEPLLCEDETSKTAWEYQRAFVEKAKRFAVEERLSGVWEEVIFLWEEALSGLNGKRHEHPVSRNLDWVVKEWLFAREEKKRTGKPFHEACADLDLAYHETNPKTSVYDALFRNGFLARIADEEEIQRGMTHPPRDTRAWLRGTIVRLFSERGLTGVGWDSASFRKKIIQMRHPSYGTKDDIGDVFLGSLEKDEMFARIHALINTGGTYSGLVLRDTYITREDIQRRFFDGGFFDEFDEAENIGNNVRHRK